MKKSDFIGLQCWLKLLCVNNQIALWDLIGVGYLFFVFLHLAKVLCVPFLPHLLCTLCSRSVEFCNSRVCAVIITHHYGSSWDMHDEPTSVRRGGGTRRDGVGRNHRGRGKRTVTAEAHWVGGEERGQDLDSDAPVSAARLVSLRNANQNTSEPLPSLCLPPSKKS